MRVKYNGRLNRRDGHKAIVRERKWGRVTNRIPRALQGKYTIEGYHLYHYVFYNLGGSKRWKKKFFTTVMSHLLENGFDLYYLWQQSLSLKKTCKLTQAQRRRLQSAIDIMQKMYLKTGRRV